MEHQELEILMESVRRPMYKIEKDIGMPMNTLQRAMKGKSRLPKKWAILLKEYVKTGGWIVANKKDGDNIDDRQNPLINAARGRDESGTNKDEIRNEESSKSDRKPFMSEAIKKKLGIK